MDPIPILITSRDNDDNENPILEVWLCPAQLHPELMNLKLNFENKFQELNTLHYKVMYPGDGTTDHVAANKVWNDIKLLKRKFKKDFTMICMLADDYVILDREYYGLD